jgi:hypothetical protein
MDGSYFLRAALASCAGGLFSTALTTKNVYLVFRLHAFLLRLLFASLLLPVVQDRLLPDLSFLLYVAPNISSVLLVFLPLP